MKRALTTLLLALLLGGVLPIVTPASVGAQDLTVLVGARGGIAIPTGDMSDEDGGATIGPGFGISGAIKITPMFGAYASYNWASFGSEEEEDDGFPEVDVDQIDSGLSVGGQAWIPMAESSLRPWVQLGVVYHAFKVDVGPFSIETDHSLGYEAGVGLDFPIAGGRLLVHPSARYRSYSFEMEFFGESSEPTVSYGEVSIGIAYPIRIGT